MVQRKLARIVGDDAAGIDDDAVEGRALPIFTPPGDVVTGGIAFGDVGLSPSCSAAVPGDRGARLRGECRGAGDCQLHKNSCCPRDEYIIAASGDLMRLATTIGLVMLAGVTGYAASDFWNKKQSSEWSTSEIDQLKTKSPWSKKVQMEMGTAGRPQSMDSDGSRGTFGG